MLKRQAQLSNGLNLNVYDTAKESGVINAEGIKVITTFSVFSINANQVISWTLTEDIQLLSMWFSEAGNTEELNLQLELKDNNDNVIWLSTLGVNLFNNMNGTAYNYSFPSMLFVPSGFKLLAKPNLAISGLQIFAVNCFLRPQIIGSIVSSF